MNVEQFPGRSVEPLHGRRAALEPVLAALDGALLGKREVVRLALAALLARGHLLIEDVPGVGKTTLAMAMARLAGLDFARVQMTSDLLPGDLIGVSIFDPASQHFQFHPGPIFHALVLVDEINRASPRTQSALLEAMAEGQVSVDGETHGLPKPFFVIATQNPGEQVGVHALPESQLDRFLMRIAVGYPNFAAERQLLSGGRPDTALPALLDGARLQALQAQCLALFVSDELLDMIQAMTVTSRTDARLKLGLSPRGMLALKASAQAWAMLAGRDFVAPEDLYAVTPAVLSHRLLPRPGQPDGQALCRLLMESVWGCRA